MMPVDQAGWSGRKRALDLSDGRRLAYVRQPGPGPALLLLHGFTDTSRSYARLIPGLATFDCVIPDLPGHGASTPARTQGIDGFAEDLLALLDHLGIAEVAILGHSMGGAVGIDLAARLGGRVTALVILASSLTPRLPADNSVARAIHALVDPIDPADPFFDEWHGCSRPVPADFLDYARREAAAIPAAVWKNVFDGLSSVDLTARAATIRCPVLCVSGVEDPLFGPAHQQALAAGFADVTTAALPGQGHNVHWEEPEALADLVGDFLDEVLGR